MSGEDDGGANGGANGVKDGANGGAPVGAGDSIVNSDIVQPLLTGELSIIYVLYSSNNSVSHDCPGILYYVK